MYRLRLRSATKLLTLQIVLLIVTAPIASLGQTPIKLHSNKFSPADDVKLGQEAAGEAEKQLQVISDPDLGNYIGQVGDRLAAAIPSEFQHAEFQYSFKVVNAKEINAFALPGGPMYVNTGMIAAAKTEDEMAGVMAHEISHVALRHGTAQVTKAQKYQMLSGILGMGGQIVGGPLGQAAQMGAQGVGVYILKFSREYETEADLLGSRIMAQAGYDPRQLANMFQTIEAQGGGGGGWFSSHPSSKDRYARINQEAQMLQINTAATPDKRDFIAAQDRVTGRRSGQGFTGNQTAYRNTPTQNSNQTIRNDHAPDAIQTNENAQLSTKANSATPANRAPSSIPGFMTVNKGLFVVDIPESWQEMEQQNGVWFAPNNGVVSTNGQTSFVHAINFGVSQTRAKNAQQATEEFVNGLRQGTKLKVHTTYEPWKVDKRPGRLIVLENVNEVTNRQEFVIVVMTQLQNGSLFYVIFVSPRDEYPKNQPAFGNMLASIRLNDSANP